MSEERKEYNDLEKEIMASDSSFDLREKIDAALNVFSKKNWKDGWIIMLACWLKEKDWLEIKEDREDKDIPLIKVNIESVRDCLDEGWFEELKGKGVSNVYVIIDCPKEIWRKIEDLSSSIDTISKKIDDGCYDLNDEETCVLFKIIFKYMDNFMYYNKGEVKKIYDYIFSKLQEKAPRSTRQFFQPSDLTKLVLEILDAKEGTVFNPYAGACYYGTSLCSDIRYYGEDSDRYACLLGNLNLLVHERVNATCSVSKQEQYLCDFEIEKGKYDYIVSLLSHQTIKALQDPSIEDEISRNRNVKLSKKEDMERSFGMEEWARLKPKYAAYDEEFLKNSALSARKKAIGVYPSTVCDHNDADMLLDDDIIESVILLPRISDFSNQTEEDSVIIVVNKEKIKNGIVRFIDARDCFLIGRIGDGKEPYMNDYIGIASTKNKRLLNVKGVMDLYRQKGTGNKVADVSIKEIKSTHYSLLPTRYTSPSIPMPKNGEERMAIGDLVKVKLLQKKNNSKKRGIGIKDLSDNYLNCDIQDDSDANASNKDLKTVCLLAGFYGGKFRVGRLKGYSFIPTTNLEPQVIPFIIKSDKISEDFLLRSIMLSETEGQARTINLGSQNSAWELVGSGYFIDETKDRYLDSKKYDDLGDDNITYFQEFCDLKIVVPSRDEQDRLCKEDVRKSLSKADSDKAKAFEDFRKDLHMKKHAIGQTIFNVRNWWDLLQHAREENHGQLADDAVVGRTNKISVSEIFANLGDAIDDLQQQISHLDRGNGLARSEFYLVEFIEDYIKHHKSPMFEYVYDGDKYRSHQDLPDYEFEEDGKGGFIVPGGDGFIIRKGDPWQSVTFSEEALRMVFDNIISNACSHGFEGREAAKNRVRITVSMEGTTHVIYISNNGKPLDPQLTADDVFAYSCSTKRGKGHYGLGGYEVKNLMREFGGDADVISTPEEEYTVTYKLTFSDTNIIRYRE